MDLMFKILVIIIIFLGEAFGIYAEIISARTNSLNSGPFLHIFLKGFLVIALAAALLIAGYMLGFKYFKNIWVVSVISITSILIVEPVLDYTIFNQLPTRGALIGLIFGILGFVSAILF